MPAATDAPGRVIIVGGGTSGWMAANLIAKAWQALGSYITVIESKEIGTIGVGEGSTPMMRNFFRQLDIPEHEWMPACNATYKCGIRFPNWSTHDGYQEYFHPFFSELDIGPSEGFFSNCGLRRRGYQVPAHPDRFFVSSLLARRCKAPVPSQALRSDLDYAYHFDAGLLGNFLRSKAIALGVGHIVDTVTAVELTERGDIQRLQTNEHGALEADLFFDCSGFAGLLIDKALQEPFRSFQENLFNDRAVAIPTPTDSSTRIESCTVSEALKHGWVWRIPLTNRYGNGYVYSSAHATAEQAEAELRRHLGPRARDAEARHLKMRVGRVERHWRNNCVAVGLSQGFIEPLEATALLLVHYTIATFIQLFQDANFTQDRQDEFNKSVNHMFDGIRDYVVMHYKTNSRSDTDYWRENRQNPKISDSLALILAAWDSGIDFDATLAREAKTQIYMRPSWYCMLAGVGRFPAHLRKPNGIKAASVRDAQAMCEQLLRLFPDHNSWLQRNAGVAA